MKYLTQSNSHKFKFRIRISKPLQPYFNKKEFNKSLQTSDFAIANKKAKKMYNGYIKIKELVRLGMIDDANIQKIVDDYIAENLSRDYQGRLNNISFENTKKIVDRKSYVHIERVLRSHNDDLSKFNASKVKILCEDFAEKLGEKFDISKTLHKKLALELMRANISIYKELLARNKGDWSVKTVPSLNSSKKQLPTIEESVEDYLKRYLHETKGADEEKTSIKNFFREVGLKLLSFVIDDLSQLDDEVIYDLQEKIPLLLKRSGKNIDVDISEYYEKALYEGDTYDKVSISTANTRMKWFRAYLTYLHEKKYTDEDLSLRLKNLDTDLSKNARVHLEREEIKQLINNTEEDVQTIVLILAYSGMRMSELYKCKFERDDGTGITYFDLSDASIKLKTKSSHRKIPIHRHLKHVITKEKLTELQINYSNNPDSISKRINNTIREKISEDKRKVSYSLRHSFSTFLRYALVDEGKTSDLMGHSSGKTLSYQRYASSFPLKELQEAINKLDYDI